MTLALHVERGGPRGGVTLLLIHPMGADLRFWDACRAIWEETRDCLAMDLSGAGASPDPGGVLTPERQAGYLEEMLLARGVTVPLCIVGCAVGAMVAVCLAARLGERAAGLVLANPGLRTDGAARAALAARAGAVRAGGMAAVVDQVMAATFAGQPEGPARAAFAARFAAQDPEAYARQIEAMLDVDTGPALEVIARRAPACPALICLGGRDLLLPPETGRAVAARLPGAHVVEFSDVAHFIPYQAPARFAAEVARWVDAVFGPRPSG